MAIYDLQGGIIATAAQESTRRLSCGKSMASRGLAKWTVIPFALAILFSDFSPTFPEPASRQPTTAAIECPVPGTELFENPPEFRSARGILKGTIVLKEEEHQRLPASRGDAVTCADVRVRAFRGETEVGKPLDPMRPAQPPAPGLTDPEPGPTLRARVGDLVQLTLVNEVNPNNFDPNIDFICTEVGKEGAQYPQGFNESKFPNCLHASSTANIHFHGTHTSGHCRVTTKAS